MEDALTLEREFDNFFAKLDFRRVSSIVGLSPTFKNADYVHQQMKVVIELKILEKDYFENGGIIDRFHQIVIIPNNVDEKGLGTYTTSFPPPGRDTFEDPLWQLLKTANKQLKETKNALFSGEGYGFVLLALNKFRSLAPGKAFDLTCSLLEEGLSSIDGFMLCTPSWDINLSNTPAQLYPPDCLVGISDKIPSLIGQVLQRIAELWCDDYNSSKVIGIRPRSYYYHSDVL